MSFIKIPIQPTQPVLTKDQLLKMDTNVIKNTGGNLLKQLAKYAEDTLVTVWKNDKYTAQEWLTAQGTSSGDAMKQHSALIMFLASQGVMIDTSMVKNYTINQDGTVTVS